MKRILTLILSLLLIVGATYAQVSLEERGYLVYIPSPYTGEDMPLMIALHGYGDTAEAFAQGTAWADTAEEYGFIVAFLNAYEQEWNSSPGGSHNEDDTIAILDLIDLISAQVNVNRDRIYLTGYSNGASMTYRALCEAPHIFAGAAIVAGSMWKGLDCPLHQQTSVLIIHGRDDTVVPFNGSRDTYSPLESVVYWSEVNQCADDDVHTFDPAYTGLQFQFYDDCESGNMVMLYAIPGLGHTWPGISHRLAGRPIPNQLNANFIIWGFFEISYEAQQAARFTVSGPR